MLLDQSVCWHWVVMGRPSPYLHSPLFNLLKEGKRSKQRSSTGGAFVCRHHHRHLAGTPVDLQCINRRGIQFIKTACCITWPFCVKATWYVNRFVVYFLLTSDELMRLFPGQLSRWEERYYFTFDSLRSKRLTIPIRRSTMTEPSLTL